MLSNSLKSTRKLKLGRKPRVATAPFFAKLQYRWQKFMFGRKQRIVAWKLCYALLAAGFSVEKVFGIIAESYREQKKNSIAKIFEEIEVATKRGAFVQAITRYVPGSESLIFSAYGQTDVTNIFNATARLTEMQAKIHNAIKSNIGPPIAMFLIFFVILYGAGKFFVPEFTKLIPLENWPATTKPYATITLFIADHFLWIASMTALVLSLLWFVMLNWTGPGRKNLDGIPPFNLYRFITGTSFLFTIIELMNAGVDLNTKTFKTMEENGSKYQRHRIGTIRNLRARGFGLGKSMKLAGHGFPSPELIPIMVSLDGTKDWVQELQKFSDMWILDATEMVQEKTAILKNLLLGLLTIFIGATFHTVFTLMTSITNIQI